MALTLPSMGLHRPTSCSKLNTFSNAKLPPQSRTNDIDFCANVKAAMIRIRSEASMQRTRQPQQQLQPKIRGPQPPPKVLLNRFPAARTVQQMMDTMEKIVEDPLAYSSISPLIIAGDDEYSNGKIPWAIKEGRNDFKMRFNMPGMNKNDVKVWVEDSMLIVKAEKELKEHHHEGQGHANGKNGELSTEHEEEQEQGWPAKSYGRYSHRIALPENIDFEKIKAQVKDGVLYVTIPKTSSSAKIIGIDVQ